jgi:hypothetical protein
LITSANPVASSYLLTDLRDNKDAARDQWLVEKSPSNLLRLPYLEVSEHVDALFTMREWAPSPTNGDRLVVLGSETNLPGCFRARGGRSRGGRAEVTGS